MQLADRVIPAMISVAFVLLFSGCVAPTDRRRSPVSTSPAQSVGIAFPSSNPPAASEQETVTSLATPAERASGVFFSVPVSEPSGIAYHPTRRTLWVVRDNGSLIEMDLSYHVLSEVKIRGDLEGVAVHPETGNVWIASERASAVLEYDIEMARIIRKIRIDFAAHADFGTRSRGNKGIEGVTFGRDRAGRFRVFCVVESSPARVIRLSADVSRGATERARDKFDPMSPAGVKEEVTQIDRSFDVGLARLSDITYVDSPPMLVVVSSDQNVVRSIDLEGKQLRTVPILGRRQEGLCFLPDGDGLISMDVDDGIFWFRAQLLRDLRP